MKIISSKRIDSQLNTVITEAREKTDSLRSLAHEQKNEEWFHLMNELCIWLGKQYEYEEFEKEIDDLDLGPAYLGNFEG